MNWQGMTPQEIEIQCDLSEAMLEREIFAGYAPNADGYHGLQITLPWEEAAKLLAALRTLAAMTVVQEKCHA